MTLEHAEDEGDGLLDIDDVPDSTQMDVSPAQDLDEGAGTTAHHTDCGECAWLVSTGICSPASTSSPDIFRHQQSYSVPLHGVARV